MDSPPDSTTPPPVSQAILCLYKPLKKFFDISMRISKLSPYLSCDTRGSGTLYNTKKGRYYLIRLSEKADLPLTEIDKYIIYTNDIELSKNHRHTFRSTSNKPNLNYILGIYLTFVFSLNRQFHKNDVNKYFNHELDLPSVNNKTVRPYYKQYRTLHFDAVRSPQQQARWNRLTTSTLNSRVVRFLAINIICQLALKLVGLSIYDEFFIMHLLSCILFTFIYISGQEICLKAHPLDNAKFDV
ncbi:hypothetical protein GLOIN_2v1837698 [Rhizophagus irregularis DAOM 181602=DAOM 197198]|nr:hypothetical protein GLOIN_2v1837698 [Rhizophagus irregularis DAOM 181602=DAOM 197198]